MTEPNRSKTSKYPRRTMRLLNKWEQFGLWLVSLGWRHVKAAQNSKRTLLYGSDAEVLARFWEHRQPIELTDSKG